MCFKLLSICEMLELNASTVGFSGELIIKQGFGIFSISSGLTPALLQATVKHLLSSADADLGSLCQLSPWVFRCLSCECCGFLKGSHLFMVFSLARSTLIRKKSKVRDKSQRAAHDYKCTLHITRREKTPPLVEKKTW